MSDEERLAAWVATGMVKCCRCRLYIQPDAQSWELVRDDVGARAQHVVCDAS